MMMLASWIFVQPRVHHMWRRLRRSRSVREDSGCRLQLDLAEGCSTGVPKILRGDVVKLTAVSLGALALRKVPAD